MFVIVHHPTTFLSVFVVELCFSRFSYLTHIRAVWFSLGVKKQKNVDHVTIWSSFLILKELLLNNLT